MTAAIAYKPAGYFPLVFPRVLLDPDPARPDMVFHGPENGMYWSREQPAMAEYLLLTGNLEGAFLTLREHASNRVIVDRAPAYLYAVGAIPDLRRDGDMLQLVWPAGAPVTSRLPPCLLMRASYLSLRWEPVRAQPEPGLLAVVLCRELTDEEIADRRRQR